MGTYAIHLPCCLANGQTENEHDLDCDHHPLNQQRRARREAAETYPALVEREAS